MIPMIITLIISNISNLRNIDQGQFVLIRIFQGSRKRFRHINSRQYIDAGLYGIPPYDETVF